MKMHCSMRKFLVRNVVLHLATAFQMFTSRKHIGLSARTWFLERFTRRSVTKVAGNAATLEEATKLVDEERQRHRSPTPPATEYSCRLLTFLQFPDRRDIGQSKILVAGQLVQLLVAIAGRDKWRSGVRQGDGYLENHIEVFYQRSRLCHHLAALNGNWIVAVGIFFRDWTMNFKNLLTCPTPIFPIAYS